MAGRSSIQYGAAAIDLDPCPIHADWILEGKPVAKVKILSTSADGTATNLIWDCTAGRFNWFYSIDETVYVIDGSVTLTEPGFQPRLITAGETIFFPAGSQAEWTVHNYVRKVAFLRSPLPAPVAMARKWLSKLKRRIRGGEQKSGAPAMFG